MFIGHYSTALVGKACAPKAPLWTMVLAAQLVDVAWAVFIATGIEALRFDTSLATNPFDLFDIPYSHSLPATLLWAAGTYVLLRRFAGNWLGQREAVVIALVVASHWFADLLVHRPDLIVWGDTKVGFGLWDYPGIALCLEVFVVIAGLVYLLTRQDLDYRSRRRILGFGMLLIAIQLSTLVIPMPLNIPELCATSLLFFLGLPLLAYLWIDRGSHLRQ